MQPSETAERLIDLDLPTVRGNHEHQILTTAPDRMDASDRLAHDSITAGSRAWFGFPAEHASGRRAAISRTSSDPSGMAGVERPPTLRWCSGSAVLRHGRCCCADTPIYLGQCVCPRGAFVVNPGSVGWPAYANDEPYPHVIEAGTPHARYAIVDDSSGSWEAELRAVVYDWERAARVAEHNQRPDVAHLRTGRA